ncbi:hypothetical protein ACW9IK_19755 [Pseudomonas gingeri]
MSGRPKPVKSVALSLRGFELSTAQVESIMGRAPSESGSRGEAPKPGVKSLLKRSFVRYSVECAHDCRIDEMIPALWSHLGGFDKIRDACGKVKPEFLEVDLVLPVKHSDEQEGGFLPCAILAELSLLGATLSFQFL